MILCAPLYWHISHYEDMCGSDTVFSLSTANLNSAIDDDKRALKSEDVIVKCSDFSGRFKINLIG